MNKETIKLELSQKNVDKLNGLSFKNKTARQSLVNKLVKWYTENPSQFSIKKGKIFRDNV